MSDKKEKLSEKQVVLKSRSLNPFHGFSDWYGTDNEAVVTFETMKSVLWNSWRKQCVEITRRDSQGEKIDRDRFESFQNYLEASNNAEERERTIDPESFNPGKLREPGIHRDGTHYDDEEKVDEAYTITVPHGFLSPELCKNYIEKLNQQFDRNFKLEIRDDQKPPLSELKRLKHRFDEEDRGLIEELEKKLESREQKIDQEKMAAVLFEDGSIEDLAGKGSWHIEHVQGEEWFLGAELMGEYVQFRLKLDGKKRITVEPYEAWQEYVEEVVERRNGKTDKKKPRE